MAPPESWQQNVLPFVWPILWILIATIAGVIVDRVFLVRLLRGGFMRRHAWIALGVDALRSGIVVWAVIFGIHAALDTSPLDRNAVHLLDDLLLVLVFGSVTLVIARFAGGAIHIYGSGLQQRIFSASLIISVVQTVVVIIGVLILLQSLGVAISPLLAALGVGGLAVALALQDTLANLFAGMQLVASHQLHPGDYVRLDSGYEGFVEDINWRNATIREIGNNLVVVPNQKLSQSIFVNYRLPEPSFAVTVPLSVTYGSDLSLVERTAIEIAGETLQRLGVANGTRHVGVRFQELSESSVRLTVSFPVPITVNQLEVRSEFIKRIYDALALDTNKEAHLVGSTPAASS